MPARADQMGEQAGVVSGAGTDLQDSLALLGVELFEHHGHDRRLGRGADRRAGAVVFGVHGLVGVCLRQRHGGHEQVAGHGPYRLLNCPGFNRALRA